jgi:hypothetical protein
MHGGRLCNLGPTPTRLVQVQGSTFESGIRQCMHAADTVKPPTSWMCQVSAVMQRLCGQGTFCTMPPRPTATPSVYTLKLVPKRSRKPWRQAPKSAPPRPACDWCPPVVCRCVRGIVFNYIHQLGHLAGLIRRARSGPCQVCLCCLLPMAQKHRVVQ